VPDYTKAPIRKRPRRIQKKIDKRYGLLRFDKEAAYILMLSRSMQGFNEIVKDETLNDLSKQMTEIVLEETQRLKGQQAP
jgi:hypothetical protein